MYPMWCIIPFIGGCNGSVLNEWADGWRGSLDLLGLIGFAIPIFTTQQTKDVAKTGDLKLQPRNALRMSFSPILAEALWR